MDDEQNGAEMGSQSIGTPTLGELAIMVDELERRVGKREDSNEGLRTIVTKHVEDDGKFQAKLLGGLLILKVGGALAAFIISTGLVVLGFVLHK